MTCSACDQSGNVFLIVGGADAKRLLCPTCWNKAVEAGVKLDAAFKEMHGDVRRWKEKLARKDVTHG